VSAVKVNGTILQLAGSTWIQIPFPANPETGGSLLPTLRAIWGASPTDILVCGQSLLDNHGVLNFDGTEWRQCSNVPTGDAHGIWGSSTNDVFLVGVDGIVHSTGP